jgi:hypothetical protein
MKELLGMVVREDYPKIGCHRLKSCADLGRRHPDTLDGCAILGLGHREKLRRVRQHRPADHARLHHPASRFVVARTRLDPFRRCVATKVAMRRLLVVPSRQIEEML